MARSLHRFVFPLAYALSSLPRPASAQNCWRDTVCSSVTDPAFPGPWEEYHYAPAARTVQPVAAYDVDTGAQVDTSSGAFEIDSGKTGIYIDFGLNVGGIVSLDYQVSSVTDSGSLGLAFTEAKNYIGRDSDSSNGNNPDYDGAIYSNFTATGDVSYQMPLASLRGGFRYVTLFTLGDDTHVTISNISLELSFQPTWSNLRAYSGYFYSNDDLLNKLWYSGAYTLQLDAISGDTGRQWPAPATGWSNDGVLGTAATYTSDGAKRDRTLWPGDMGISIPAGFYSTGDLESVLNTLAVLYGQQDANDGGLPFAGPPVNAGAASTTYHLWTMIGLYEYVLYSGDVDFLSSLWSQYNKAMSFALALIDANVGLVDVSNYPNDWGRKNTTGYQASAQMLLYHTLMTGAEMSSWVGDTTASADIWTSYATNLSTAVQDKLWDASVGAFKDNYGSYDFGLHPQDGNSLAITSGLVDPTSDQAQSISQWLTTNWVDIGAQCPELPTEISPYISSIEIEAHIRVGQPQRALDLIRTSWGWYLNNENGTQSSMIEGYLTDGGFGYRFDVGYSDASYTSHAHGWSTGPVTTLSSQILGLSITSPAGKTWDFTPQPGDLESIEGGFTTSLGQFKASVSVGTGGRPLTYSLNTPEGTNGTVNVPAGSCTKSTMVHRRDSDISHLRAVTGPDGRRFYKVSVGGGNHTFTLS